MATHYYMYSWPVMLDNIWFSHHHTVHRLKSCLAPKGEFSDF